MDKKAEGQELLEGLAVEVATAYQTERPMLLEQLQGHHDPVLAQNLVRSVVRGTSYDFLKMLKDTKAEQYRLLLQSFGCNSDDDFANKAGNDNLLQSNGFDVSAEAQALMAETANSEKI